MYKDNHKTQTLPHIWNVLPEFKIMHIPMNYKLSKYSINSVSKTGLKYKNYSQFPFRKPRNLTIPLTRSFNHKKS